MATPRGQAVYLLSLRIGLSPDPLSKDILKTRLLLSLPLILFSTYTRIFSVSCTVIKWEFFIASSSRRVFLELNLLRECI